MNTLKITIALLFLSIAATGCSDFDSITSGAMNTGSRQESKVPDFWDVTYEIDLELAHNESRKFIIEELGLLVLTGLKFEQSSKINDTNIEQMCEHLQVETDYPGDKAMIECKLDGISASYVIVTNTGKQSAKVTMLITGKTKVRLIEARN